MQSYRFRFFLVLALLSILTFTTACGPAPEPQPPEGPVSTLPPTPGEIRTEIPFTPDPTPIFTEAGTASPPTPAATTTAEAMSHPVHQPELLNARRAAQVGGRIQGIVTQGDMAYVGQGSRVAAIDISRPSFPELKQVSPILPGQVEQLLLIPGEASPSLLVNAGSYLVRLEIAEDGEMSVSGQLRLPGAVSALAMDEQVGIVYAAGAVFQHFFEYSGYVAAVEVTGAGGLEQVDQVELPERVTSLAPGRGVLYAGMEEPGGGLYAIPLGSTARFLEPKRLYTITSEDYRSAYAMQVIGDRLYIGSYGSLLIYDISDPLQVVEVWKDEDWLGMVMAFGPSEDYIYTFGWQPAGSYIPLYQAIMPPQAAGGEVVGQISSRAVIHEGHFLTANQALEIFALQDLVRTTSQEAQAEPWRPQPVGVYQSPVTYVMAAGIRGDKVYVVEGSLEGQPDPGNPLLHTFQLPDLSMDRAMSVPVEIGPDRDGLGYFGLSDFFVIGERAYLVDTYGVAIYDLSGSLPILLNRFELSRGVREAELAVISESVILFTGEPSDSPASELVAYDMSDPLEPVRLHRLPLERPQESVQHLLWTGTHLGVIYQGYPQGDVLQIFGFDGQTLSPQGEMRLPGRIYDMDAAGDLMILVGEGWLWQISLADPLVPEMLATLWLGEVGQTVKIVDEHIWVSMGTYLGEGQLLVFELYDPQGGMVKSWPIARGLRVTGRIGETHSLLLGGSGSGLEVLEVLDGP